MDNFWIVTEEERTYLHDLAQRQAEYAALPIMVQRKQQWYDLNDGPLSARPPVIIESWTFERDFMPENIFRYSGPMARMVEAQLLKNVRNYEILFDDKVMPDTFDISWFVFIDEFGIMIERETVKDAQGYELGYHEKHPIKDLHMDFELLKPASVTIDRNFTYTLKGFIEGVIGDILPVTICTPVTGRTDLTTRVVELMGMEAFMLALYECPDEVHRLMAYLRDNCLRVMRLVEAEGLMTLNNGNQESFGSSFNFTTQLPAQGYVDGPARLSDMWGWSNSQETIGISPKMFLQVHSDGSCLWLQVYRPWHFFTITTFQEGVNIRHQQISFAPS